MNNIALPILHHQYNSGMWPSNEKLRANEIYYTSYRNFTSKNTLNYVPIITLIVIF